MGGREDGSPTNLVGEGVSPFHLTGGGKGQVTYLTGRGREGAGHLSTWLGEQMGRSLIYLAGGGKGQVTYLLGRGRETAGHLSTWPGEGKDKSLIYLARWLKGEGLVTYLPGWGGKGQVTYLPGRGREGAGHLSTWPGEGNGRSLIYLARGGKG